MTSAQYAAELRALPSLVTKRFGVRGDTLTLEEVTALHVTITEERDRTGVHGLVRLALLDAMLPRDPGRRRTTEKVSRDTR